MMADCSVSFGVYKAHRTPYHSFPASERWCVVIVLGLSMVLCAFTGWQVPRNVRARACMRAYEYMCRAYVHA